MGLVKLTKCTYDNDNTEYTFKFGDGSLRSVITRNDETELYVREDSKERSLFLSKYSTPKFKYKSLTIDADGFLPEDDYLYDSEFNYFSDKFGELIKHSEVKETVGDNLTSLIDYIQTKKN